MTEAPDERTVRLRCALFAYLDQGCAERFMDEDEARASACEQLAETVEGFVLGRLNFGTLKYRLDNASAAHGYLFPPPSVTAVLSDLALGVPIDDLEPAMRAAARLPEDLGAAKGALLDLQDFLERTISRGFLKRGQVEGGRWIAMPVMLWHIQDRSWPPGDRSARSYLIEREGISALEPAQDYVEYASAVREMADAAGAEPVTMEHLLSCLKAGAVEVPSSAECFDASMEAARAFEGEGLADQAIERYERALALRPDTPIALRKKAELYEKKGLIMAAIAELEALIELEPKNLADHQKLLALYKSRKMIREYNAEVRRFKALMLGPSAP
jgi:tetratricopeptide (TPR) repeat protein